MIAGVGALLVLGVWVAGFVVIALVLPIALIAKIAIGIVWLLAGRGVLACLWDLVMLPLALLGIPVIYLMERNRRRAEGDADDAPRSGSAP